MKHSISAKIKHLSQSEIDELEERITVLKELLKTFDVHARKLSLRDQQAVSYLLCDEIAGTILLYQASVDKLIAEEGIQRAGNVHEAERSKDDFLASLRQSLRLYVGI
jgi:hypothetical protein